MNDLARTTTFLFGTSDIVKLNISNFAYNSLAVRHSPEIMQDSHANVQNIVLKIYAVPCEPKYGHHNHIWNRRVGGGRTNTLAGLPFCLYFWIYSEDSESTRHHQCYSYASNCFQRRHTKNTLTTFYRYHVTH